MLFLISNSLKIITQEILINYMHQYINTHSAKHNVMNIHKFN
jgi:hypothetical protein